jgi:hypothetical protein
MEARDAALVFIRRHGGEHLSHDRLSLLRRCRDHLVDLFPTVSTRTAEELALQAVAESEVSSHARFDLDASTSHVLQLIDGDGQRVVVTIADVIDLLGAQRERRHFLRDRSADAAEPAALAG